MTVSAIDEMAPERVILALGTGLPLRLGQMGIPYDARRGASERVSEAIDTLRALWAGERIPSATPGLPPDPADVPAGAPRTDLHRRLPLAHSSSWPAQKADGYLARPAESIPSLRGDPRR